MPSLGPAEILVILVIALLVFGPNKMPEIARQVGKGMREFRRVQQHLSTELRDVVAEFDGPTEPATADPGPAPVGDPVPMLPPKLDTAAAVEPTRSLPADSHPADSEPAGSGGHAEPAPPVSAGPATPPPAAAPPPADRGQRVWPPAAPPTSA